MKKIYNSFKIVFLLILSLLVSCSKFEDINTNPDATTQVSSSLLCTNVVLSIARFSGRDAKSYLTDNALPKYIGYANEGQMGAQYNSIGSSSFEAMTILPDIDKMLEYAKGSVLEDSYKGVAHFARAYMFFRLTMEMGDIPYSESNLGATGNYRPKYDRQEEILIGILNELKAADTSFANGRTFSGDPTPYNGNPAKWQKATNALALKILMTLSKKEGVASLEVKKRFQEIVAAGNLMESTTGFFGLNYSTQNKHPLSGTSNLFTSRTIISSLLINNLKKLNDRRMFYYAEPAGAKISAGKTQSDTAAYVGVDVSMDYASMNTGHSANAYSLLNKRYLTEAACEPRMLLTFAEQQLIIAEAIVRGWITTGTAQTYYQEGVKSALASIMATKSTYAHTKVIDQVYINGYFTGEAAFKATEDEQLKQIWMQRYILNFMQDAQYSYFEYRRNGYPEFPINPATSLNENNKNGLPLRWLYPGSETDYNRENLVDALNNQYDGYDEINKVMWLLK
ncbi:MAG: SusD/RagB family nutrient-binding outer membrane lipoprotein [Porphyromonadaceae bacterium]|nr:MAG: SusD/RagB family nutrient-binding outer membrane lipoprotein [Porphyromonadaceae bacterium]